jgi:hypothetical protein
MKSLFLKIFLSFWVAQASVSCAGDPGDAGFRPQRNSTWEALRTTALTDAIGAYEQWRNTAGARLSGNLQR